MLLEIAVYSIEAALAAQQAGADRIELCTAPAEGGLTPSAATLRIARKWLRIPIHAMIRPREGDFCYSPREFEVMLLDIAAASVAGVNGIVTGILSPDGSIDQERMNLVVQAAGKMNVTCHRAFDMARDPEEAMEALIECGVSRILTSGGRQTAVENLPFIANLVEKAGNRITIMPGSGINEENIQEVAEKTGAFEFHLSAKKLLPGRMEFRNELISMGGNAIVPEYDLLLPDGESIGRIIQLFQPS